MTRTLKTASSDQTSIKNIIPRDIEAEEALLASIILDNQKLQEVLGIGVEADRFDSLLHRIIFEAILRIAGRGDPIDLVTLASELRSIGALESEVEKVTLYRILDGHQRGANISAYARRVMNMARLRDIQRHSEDLVNITSNGADPAQIRELIAKLAAIQEPGATALPSEDFSDIIVRPIPQTPWMADGMLAEGDISILSGPGGLGKSWLVLYVAIQLALGKSLFGRFTVTRPYNVAVLDLESRPWEIDQRLCRLAKGLGVDAEKLRGRLRVIRRRVRLDDPAEMARVVASIREWKTSLLIVDSFRRMFRGDENSSEAVSDLFNSRLDPLRLDTGCGVLITDHVRKNTGDRELDQPEEAMRGSGDKRNMVDTHVGLQRREERIALYPSKTRHGFQPEPFLVEIEGLTADAPDDGPVTVSYVGAIDKASDHVQDSIVALLDGGAEIHRGELIGRSIYSERAVTDALSALKRRGRVSSRKDGKLAFYSLKAVKP